MAKFELRPINLCFLDLETTGLDEKRNDIIEAAAVRVSIQPGPDWASTWTVEKTVDAKVMPAHPYVEPFVARINGFSAEAWQDARLLPEVLVELYDCLHMSIVIGSKPDFDARFLEAGFTALGWNFPRMLSYHRIDVPTLWIKLVLEGKIQKIKQETVGEFLGLPKQEHRAMADVQQCIEIFRRFVIPEK